MDCDLTKAIVIKNRNVGMSESTEKILLEILSLQKIVMECREELAHVHKKYENANTRLIGVEEQFNSLHDLTDRISSLENIMGARKVDTVTPVLDRYEAYDAYKNCSPKQHAVIQMIFDGKTTPEIAERLSVTENGAKSQVRYLCNRLKVNSKSEIILNYKSIWEDMSDDDYFNLTKIPKNWCKKYGNLNYNVAKRKDDYFTIICETNYRRPIHP